MNLAAPSGLVTLCGLVILYPNRHRQDSLRASVLHPHAAVQRPVPHRLGNVLGLDLLGGFKIGNCSSHTQHLVVGARSKKEKQKRCQSKKGVRSRFAVSWAVPGAVESPQGAKKGAKKVSEQKRCQESFRCLLGRPWGRRVASRPSRRTI